MDSGIYKILCTTSGKFYIGSSQQLTRRKIYHFNRLRANKHPNPHLQNSYNLYGEQSFLYEVIKYCTVSDLLQEEQQIIDYYWEKKVLFNVAKIAGASFRNKRHSEKTKEKMRANGGKAWRGKNMSAEHKKKISDKRIKLTRQRGLRKLTDDQVRQIRRLKNNGLGDRKVAKMFNVSRKIITCIRKGTRYFDVENTD